MRSSNVDLVRSLFDAWRRADWSSVEWAHPEIEFNVADGPLPGAWKGVRGMIEGYREVMNAWENYAGEAEAYRELPDRRVLVLIRLSGRGKSSGLELSEVQPKAAGVFCVRDGKVASITLYWDRQRALGDLGERA